MQLLPLQYLQKEHLFLALFIYFLLSVNAEIKENGNIKAVEKTSGSVTTKDLFMALDYFNYFSNKLETKYLKDDEDSGDFDIQDWSFLAELCAI
jgi:hypothetical protein